MKQYLDLAKRVMSEGEYEWNNRTGTGTLSLFGEKCIYDMRDGFPLLTTKKVPWRLPIEEMMFFLRGDDNLGDLLDRNIHIWDANAFDFYLRRHGLESKFEKNTPEWNSEFEVYVDKVKYDEEFRESEGSLGRIYGVQARDWMGPDGSSVDQLKNFLDKLGRDPSSRSNIVSHFNPAEMKKMSLGPCHLLYQSRVIEDENRLDLMMFQRSADELLGVPFNQVQYAFLINAAAEELGLTPGKFSHLFGNVHYYIGTTPRSDFLRDKDNLKEFQGRFGEAVSPSDYIELKDWYLENAPRERPGSEGLDQIPFGLVQFSRGTRDLPKFRFKVDNFDFWDAIKMDARDLVEIEGYKPHSNVTYEFDGKLYKPRMAA